MITTLSGENDYGLTQALILIIKSFNDQYGDLAIERLYGDELDLTKLAESLVSLPFLSPKKLVILSAPSKSKPFLEDFEKLFSSLNDTTDLVIVESKLDKRLSYYKYLKSKTDFKDFSTVQPAGLASWLVSEAKAADGHLKSADAQYLVERVGTNQQQLSSDLEKLLISNPVVSRQSIDDLTEASPSSTIFELLEAAFNGRSKLAIDLYKQQRAQMVEVPQIVAMLAWQLHILAIVKTAGNKSSQEIAKQAKVNPYVLDKSVRIARTLSLSKLRDLIDKLEKLDKSIKNTSLDPEVAMQNYLLDIASN